MTSSDQFTLSAAIGWLELGNPAEARAELERLSPETRSSPDALEIEWAICAEEKNWSRGLSAAERLIEVEPDRPSGWLHRSYATRRAAGGVGKAMELLLPASAQFPEEPLIPYNLACYACQLGRLEEARTWLRRALAVGGVETFKQLALGDADLEPLWAELDAM
jgi:tetratricopeptide (TPR) repeat protein